MEKRKIEEEKNKEKTWGEEKDLIKKEIHKCILRYDNNIDEKNY